MTEKKLSNYVQSIVTATPDILNNFSHDRQVVVHNYPFIPSDIDRLNILSYLDRNPIVVYTGGLTKVQGAVEMLSAIDLVPESLNATFQVAGWFNSATLMEQLQTTSGWKKTNYLGTLNREDVIKLVHTARVGLIIDYPIPNYITALSTKMFEYMSAGIPIIASNFSLWASIVNKHNCGILVDPYNPREIADAIVWILEHPIEAMEMGKRGQKAIIEEYNWDREAATLLQLYKSLTLELNLV